MNIKRIIREEVKDFTWIKDASILGDGTWVIDLYGADKKGCYKEVQEWLVSQGRTWSSGNEYICRPDSDSWQAFSTKIGGHNTTSYAYWTNNGWTNNDYDVRIRWLDIKKHINESDDFDWIKDIGTQKEGLVDKWFIDIRELSKEDKLKIQEYILGLGYLWGNGRNTPNESYTGMFTTGYIVENKTLYYTQRTYGEEDYDKFYYFINGYELIKSLY